MHRSITEYLLLFGDGVHEEVGARVVDVRNQDCCKLRDAV